MGTVTWQTDAEVGGGGGLEVEQAPHNLKLCCGSVGPVSLWSSGSVIICTGPMWWCFTTIDMKYVVEHFCLPVPRFETLYKETEFYS